MKEDLKKKARKLWLGIRNRVGKKDAYKDVKLCDEWQEFDNFLSWFNHQVEMGWYRYGREIDKDLLSPRGSKIYSPETCCFIPPRVNSFLVENISKTKRLPPNVKYDSYMDFYYSVFRMGNRLYVSNYYECPYKAFLYYRSMKEDMARQVAEVVKDRVEPKVYEALLNYKLVWDGEKQWHEDREVLY